MATRCSSTPKRADCRARTLVSRSCSGCAGASRRSLRSSTRSPGKSNQQGVLEMDAETVEAIAQRITKSELLELGPEHKILVRPDGEVVDLRALMPLPDRIKQMVEMLNVPGLLAYIKRYGSLDTVIFANEPAAQYEVIIDYHSGPMAYRRDCDHIARYTCPQSEPWKLWNLHNGKMVGQVDFATFLENN